MTATPAISVDGITVRFGERTVLERFSLDVAEGERVALAGRSGAGKTTVLRAVLGFVVPDEGRVAIGGERLDSESVWRLRRRLAYVAQEPDLGPGTAREALERPFDYRANAHCRENLAILPQLLERFLLPHALLDEDISTLSGGEKQRVALISAVLLGRRIFLLDEPSSALDPASKEAVADFFRAKDGATVLSISHETGSFSIADRVVALAGGTDSGEAAGEGGSWA